MTYEDLPHDFRTYAATLKWDHKQALEYWRTSAEYRNYITEALCSKIEYSIKSSASDPERLATYNDALRMARGYRAKIS